MIGLKIEKLITIVHDSILSYKLLFGSFLSLSQPFFFFSIALSFLICHLTSVHLQVLSQLTIEAFLWHQCRIYFDGSVGLKQGTSAEVPVAAVPLAVPARPVDQWLVYDILVTHFFDVIQTASRPTYLS
jgi:hypothetical protein